MECLARMAVNARSISFRQCETRSKIEFPLVRDLHPARPVRQLVRDYQASGASLFMMGDHRGTLQTRCAAFFKESARLVDNARRDAEGLHRPHLFNRWSSN